MLANGLARMSYNASMVGTLKGMNASNAWQKQVPWMDDVLPKAELGYGGDPWNISSSQKAGATQFTMIALAYGYAYGSEGAAQKASIAVLLLYILLAVSHFVYSAKTGKTSSSSDTSPELAALALNSERTQQMPNTGAGISNLTSFEEPIWIRALTDGRVQFVLRDTRHAGNERKLVTGKVYG